MYQTHIVLISKDLIVERAKVEALANKRFKSNDEAIKLVINLFDIPKQSIEIQSISHFTTMCNERVMDLSKTLATPILIEAEEITDQMLSDANNTLRAGMCLPSLWKDSDLDHAAKNLGVELFAHHYYEILQLLEAQHDPEEGITWDTIDVAIKTVMGL